MFNEQAPQLSKQQERVQFHVLRARMEKMEDSSGGVCGGGRMWQCWKELTKQKEWVVGSLEVRAAPFLPYSLSSSFLLSLVGSRFLVKLPEFCQGLPYFKSCFSYFVQ